MAAIAHIGEKPVPSYGELLTIKEFYADIRNGTITDYDGFGEWSDGKVCWGDPWRPETLAIPSKFSPSNVPEGATHVVWFNR